MFNKDGLLKINPSVHSPHQIIISLIKPNTTILDVGCNTGMLGKVLCHQDILDGIDINSIALKKARSYYRHLYKIDLSKHLALNIKFKYDYIIFSDILEHLPRPDLLLLQVKKLLKPHGRIICSLPNIARFEIRLNLLFGHFDYTNSGILNQDHLRFFNQHSGKQLFLDTGYRILKIIPTGLGHNLKLFTNLTAFQFVYVVTSKK